MTSKTAFDLIFRPAVPASRAAPGAIAFSDGRMAAIAPRLESHAPEVHVDGRLVLPGFVDTHIHLDKACLLGRCGHDHGSVSEAIAAVAAMKRDFSVEDVYARGARVIERAIVHGTTRMRSHVEIDPRIGFRRVAALGVLTEAPGAEERLWQALRDGGEVLGGCPYTDTDPNAHLARIFDLAQEFDV